MTNEAMVPWVKYRSGQFAKPGDLIAYSLNTYRDGKVVGTKIMLVGRVTAVFQSTTRGHWKLKVLWPVHDRIRASLYFGQYDWVYAHQVTLYERPNDAKR